MIKSLKLAAILSLPLLLLEIWGNMHGPTMGFAILFCLLLSLSLIQLSHKSWLQLGLKIILVLLYLFTLFMTFIEAVTFDFTGQGFTHEFYYHISLDAFRVGLDKYGWGLVLLLALMFAMVYGLLKWTLNVAKPHPVAYFVFLLSLLVCTQTVTGRFLMGWHVYNKDDKQTIKHEHIDHWKKNGFINHNDVPLKQLTSATHGSKNLILVYLESFNQFFIDTPPFNSLTPNINALSEKYTHIPHQSAAYVTIEGLVSSQCGTLLTMKKGNDSMMKAENFIANLPCLGDVLSEAGYQQYYLGGAKMEFAGKGDFLSAHGYEHIMGLNYWKSQPIETNSNVWGLGDDELFNQAFNVIKEADKKSAPYNVSLLTLGTHIPGFTYPECTHLDLNEDPFLAAIQCTDYLLVNFIKRLESANYLDDTLLMVVADHGVFPNPKMKLIFGELANDRRLVAITNHPNVPTSQPMAGYDLAPTVLKWLNIEHGTPFLFGQVIDEPSHSNHKHLTRTKDWHEGQLVKNPNDECLQSSSLLSECDKKNLLSWVNQKHAKMSKTSKIMSLSCQTNIVVNLKEKNKELRIDDTNLYEDFHYNGFYMGKRQYDNGWFLLRLDKSRNVTSLGYWKDKEISIENRQQKIDTELASDGLLVHVTDQNELQIESKINGKWQAQTAPIINLCN